MKLGELLTSLSFYKSSTKLDEQLEIKQIEMDSRQVQPDSIFVCIQGFTVDGHDYVKQAVEKGAVIIVAEKEISSSVPVILVNDTKRALAMLANKFYNYPTSHLPLIGITGTNGKTTVTYLLEEICNQHSKKTGVIGTIQTKIGSQVYPVENTTPNSLELQRIFKQMVDADVEQAIMEVSSHALDQERVFGCDYDIAVFTNLSQDHLDYHHNMKDYLRAKSLLFAQLGNSYDQTKKKYGVINVDDKAGELVKKSTAQHIVTYGIKHAADVMAKDISLHIYGTEFSLVTPNGAVEINSRLIGMFNIYNMLAASGAALCMGIPLPTIKSALEAISGVNGRFEPVDSGQDYGVVVDYAHTPDSLENVLQTVKEFAKRNIYVVVGCGGDRDKKKRPLMAQIAVQYATHAIFTSDNPRTEDPEGILQDMVNGLTEEQANYEVVTNRKEAIFHAIALAKKDDIILIAGKGHETYQQIGHEKIHFDDREIARDAIGQKGE